MPSLAAIVAALVPPFVWFAVHWGHLAEAPLPVVLWSGASIFGGAFLLSWAAEVVQLDVPRALALAAVALIAVLPEYAVDVYFAWRAGDDPTYTAYAAANMTGGNRLLIGIGWAVPILAAWARFGEREVALPREQAVEVRYLALATIYSFILPVKGTLSLFDTLVLFGIFIAYARAASRTHHEEPELEGPAELIGRLATRSRRTVTALLALVAGAAIFTAAEPFAEGLLEVGREYHVEEFLLVQWIAPLASESPEFIVATLFALKGATAAGIGTMISSKVNQWTLLIGALPAAFALSSGGFGAMVLDARQREEIFLTSAQSLFALIVISNYTFSVAEALALFALFTVQLLFFTSQTARLAYAVLYMLISAAVLALNAPARRGLIDLVRRRTA